MKLLTIKEAAAALKVTEKTLRRWEVKKFITPIRTNGRHRRYSLEQLKTVKKYKNKKNVNISEVRHLLSNEINQVFTNSPLVDVNYPKINRPSFVKSFAVKFLALILFSTGGLTAYMSKSTQNSIVPVFEPVTNNQSVLAATSFLNSEFSINIPTILNSTLTLGSDTISDFTGDGLSIVNGALTAEVPSLGDDIISSEIVDGTIAEVDLLASNTPSGSQYLSFNSTTGGFTWSTPTDIVGSNYFTDSGDTTYLTSTSDDFAIGGSSSSAPFFIDSSTGTINLNKTAAGKWINFSDGTDTWGLYNRAGTPEGFITANTGTLAMDTANGTLYVKTDDNDATDWVNLATGTGSPWDEASGLVTLNTITSNVNIGGSSNLGKLAVDGDTDEVQLLVQGNGTQTSDLIVFENSSGTNLLTLSNTGALTIANAYTLPTVDGAADNYVLTTNGAGTVAWESISGAGGFTGFTLSGDTGSDQTISDGNTLEIAGGTNGIDTVGTATDTITLNFDATEVGTVTFGSGSGFTWTFDAGATDPTIAFATGSINIGGSQFTIDTTNGNLVTAGDIAINGGDITTSGDLTLTITGGDLFLANTNTLNIGGNGTDVAYNAIGDSTSGASGNVDSDDDLYVEGNIEVDGSLYAGGVDISTFVCPDCIDFDDMEDTLDLDSALIINQDTSIWTQNFTGLATTGFSYNANSLTTGSAINITTSSNPASSGPVSVNQINATTTNATTATTLTVLDIGLTNNPSVAGNTEYILQIQNESTSNTTDNAITGLIRIDNADTNAAGSTIATNGLLITNSGDITGGIVNAINIDDTDITTDIVLQNDETIDNNTDGTILLTATNSSLSGDLIVQGGDITLNTAGTIIPSASGTITIGNSNLTALTITTDGTGDTELVLPTGSISGTEILDSTINEIDLNVTNSPTAAYILSYDAGGGFTWISNTGGTGASKFTDSGSLTYLTDSTDSITVGSSTELAKLAVDGDANEVQFLVQGNGTQSSNLFVAENSSGTDFFVIEDLGGLAITPSSTDDIAITTDADSTINISGLAAGSGTALCLDGSSNIVTCSAGSSSATLQSAYDADTNGSDTLITLSSNDDSIIIRNPASSGTDSAFNFQVDNIATGLTVSAFKNLYVTEAGSFNTTAGSLTNYAGFLSNTSTESAGSNTLTNVGLYVTSSGGDTNYSGLFESGNFGIGDTSPISLFSVGSGDLFQVNSSGNIVAIGGAAHSISDSSGDLAFVSTDDFIFSAVAGSEIDITASASTVTDGVIDINIDTSITGGFEIINTSLTVNNGASSDDDFTSQLITLTANDADADVFGLQINSGATANAAAGSYEALIRLDNVENTIAAVTDGILITSSSSTDQDITDAIDVSHANILNAINVGANVILGTTGDINLTNFDVTGSNGDITTAGDIAVNGGDITTSGDLTINPTGGDLFLSNATTLNIGGNATDVAYNIIGDNNTNASVSMTSDDDLYIEGFLEVDSGVNFSPDSTNDVTIATDADSTLIVSGLSAGTGNALCVDGSSNVVTCTVGSGGVSGSGTAGQVAFFDTTSNITSEASGFGWDATNNLFTITAGTGNTTQTTQTISSTAQGLTSGGLLNANLVNTSATASFTGDILGISSNRDNDLSQTLTDTGNLVEFGRTTTTNAAGATTNVTGAVLNITNSVTATSGTINDSANLIAITQDADATGALLYLNTNRSSTGTALLIEQSSGGTDILQVQDNGNLTILGTISDSNSAVTIDDDLTITTGTTISATSVTSFNCTDCIDFDDIIDSSSLDTDLAIAAGVGEEITLNKSYTNNTGENALVLNLTASDTGAGTTAQYGIYIDNLASTEGADALITLNNTDADDAVENGILFSAGGAGTDFTDGIDFSAANLTREIVLENGEAIINQSDDVITFEDDGGTDYATLSVTALTVAGDLAITGGNITTGVTFDSTATVTGTFAANDQSTFTPSTTNDITFNVDTDSLLTLDSSVANADNFVISPNNAGTGATFTGTLTSNNLTDNRTWTLKDADGTIAFTSDIPTSDNYQYWTISDGSTTTNITSTATATFTGGTGVDTSNSSGNVTFTFDSTEVNDLTFGDNSDASIVWTFNQSTGTDPTITFSDNLITVGQGLTVTGTTTTNSTLDANGQVDLGDGGDVITISGSDTNIAVIDNSSVNIDGDSTPNSDLLVLGNGDTTATTGIDALSIVWAAADGADLVNSGINIAITSNGTGVGDIIRGLFVDLASVANATSTNKAIEIENTAAWDTDIELQNDETIDNVTDGTINLGTTIFGLTGTTTITATSLTTQTVAAAFTINSLSYIRVGDTASPGIATGDDALFVEGALEIDGTTTLDGIINVNGGDGSDFDGSVTFNDDVTITQAGAETTDITNASLTDTTGGLDLNFTTVTDAISGINLDFTNDEGAGASTGYAMIINVDDNATTANDTVYGLYLDNENSGDSDPDKSASSLLVIDNSDTNDVIADGILFVSAGGGFTDFIDTPSSVFKVDGSGNITGAALTVTGNISDSDSAVTINDDLTITTGTTISASSITTLNCTDCIDFDDLANSPTIDEATDINLSTFGLNIDLDSTGDFVIRDGATAFVTFNENNLGQVVLADGALLDLSAILHDDTTIQGFRLPQNTALTNPASGEGFLAWDTDDNLIKVYDGSAWSNISGASTTLQQAYTNDVDGSDVLITLDATEGNLIVKPIAGTNFQVAQVTSAPTTDMVAITNATLGTITNGVDGLSVNFVTANGADPTNNGINISITSGGTATTDITNGLFVDLASTAGGTDTAINIDNTAAWDIDIDLQNDETISNAVDGTIALTATSTTFSGDITVTGGDITGANSETIDIGETDNGSFIFTAAGETNNESLELDLETTSNAASLFSSTGVVTLDLGSSIYLTNVGNSGTDFTATGGLTLDDILTVNDDLDVVLAAGENISITDSAAITADVLSLIADANTTSDGIDGIFIDFRTGNGTNPTNNAINIDLTSGGGAGDTLIGLDLALSGTGGTERGINFSDNNFDTDINATTDLTIGIGGTNEVTLDGTSLSPSVAEQNSLGTASLEWEEIFVGDNAGVKFGLDQDWSMLYDEATDDRLELTTAGTTGMLIQTANATGTSLNLTTNSLTTGTGFLIDNSANTLTTGTLLQAQSTGTSLTTAGDAFLGYFDWTPGSATTASGDLFRINIGANGNVSHVFNVTDAGSTLFSVSETQIESAIPHLFSAAGDVNIAYDLVFTNQTASTIDSYGPLTIKSGESFESNNLTLQTYNSGQVVVASASGQLKMNVEGWIEANLNHSTSSTEAVCGTSTAEDAYDTILDDCTTSVNADYAEIYPTESDVNYGDIVIQGPNKITSGHNAVDENGQIVSLGNFQLSKLTRSNAPYQENVIGIASNNWSDFSSTGASSVPENERPLPIALSGRVPVNVTTESGSIVAGDILTTSSTPGAAMKAVESGRIIGQALEDFNGNGVGQIMVFVNNSYYNKPPENAVTREEIESLLMITEQNQALLEQSASWNTKTATSSAEFSDLITNNLFVTGIAALDSISVSQTVTLNNNLVIGNGNIDSLTTPLNIQGSGAQALNFMAGKVAIDTSGNMIVQGDLKVLGTVDAGKVSVSQAVAGTASILAGTNEITLTNENIKAGGLIFITPTSPTKNNIYVKNQIDGQAVIGFDDPTTTDINFNWWIVGITQ